MKGVIICGGLGKRLKPITSYMNKHLIPIYNKPMFFYPLSLLFLCGCNDIYLVGNKSDFNMFKKSIPKKILKKKLIHFIIQKKADGIASAIGLTSKYFKENEKGIFILGDNFFYGNNLINIIKKSFKKNCSTIFLSHAKDPWNYGTVAVNKKKLSFFEKKKNSDPNSVVTGLYIFDKQSINFSKQIRKSARGEYEIMDMISMIYNLSFLSVVKLGKGIAWYDLGSFKNINKVSNLVGILEERQGLGIGNLV